MNMALNWGGQIAFEVKPPGFSDNRLSARGFARADVVKIEKLRDSADYFSCLTPVAWVHSLNQFK